MAWTLDDYLKSKQENVAKASSGEPLDMGQGTRPRMTTQQYEQEQQTAPTGAVGDTEQLPKYMQQQKQPKPEVPPAQPEVPQDTQQKQFKLPLNLPEDTSDVPNVFNLPNVGLNDAGNVLDKMKQYGGNALDFIYHTTPMGMAENVEKNIFGEDSVEEFKRNEALPIAGGLLAATLFPPSLLGDMAAAGLGGAGGKLIEQTMKKNDLMEWGDKEKPWTTYGDLAERVGYEGAVDAVTAGTVGTLTRGTGWAASKAAKAIKARATSSVKAGMEDRVARIRAGDGNEAAVPAYYLFNNGLLKTVKAIVENSNITGAYAKQVNKSAAQRIYNDVYGHGIKPKITGEAADIVKSTIEKEVPKGSNLDDILSDFDDELGVGDTTAERMTEIDREHFKTKVSGALKNRQKDLVDEIEASAARLNRIKKVAKAQNINDFDSLLKTYDTPKTQKRYMKLHKDFQETLDSAHKEQSRIDSLTKAHDDIVNERVKFKDDDALISDHLDATVDEVLNPFNNLGRSNVIYQGLVNAKAYGEVASSLYYQPLSEAMGKVEQQMGGGFIDPAPLNKIVRSRIDSLSRIAQDEPEVAKLASLSDDYLTYDDARSLVSKLKETSRNLGYDNRSTEANFLRSSISTLEGQIKEGLNTAESTLLSDFADGQHVLPNGEPLAAGDLGKMYERANSLYRQTQEGFGNRWVASLLKHAETDEGAANQVMNTVLNEPNAAKSIMDFLKRQKLSHFEEDGIQLPKKVLEKYGIEPTSTAEVHATLKGGAMVNLFTPSLQEGEYVLKANRHLLDKNREALNEIFTPTEMERVNKLMDIVETVENTNKSGMFSFLQPAKEYHLITFAIKGILKGGSWIQHIAGDVAKKLPLGYAMNRAGRYLVSPEFTEWMLDVQKANAADPVIANSLKTRLRTSLINYMTGMPTDSDGSMRQHLYSHVSGKGAPKQEQPTSDDSEFNATLDDLIKQEQNNAPTQETQEDTEFTSQLDQLIQQEQGK